MNSLLNKKNLVCFVIIIYSFNSRLKTLNFAGRSNIREVVKTIPGNNTTDFIQIKLNNQSNLKRRTEKTSAQSIDEIYKEAYKAAATRTHKKKEVIRFSEERGQKLIEAGLMAVDPNLFELTLSEVFFNPEAKDFVKTNIDFSKSALKGENEPTPILLGGPPGTGKTTLLNLIAKEMNTDSDAKDNVVYLNINTASIDQGTIDALFQESKYLAEKLDKVVIVLLDEVDTIGRSRSLPGGDPLKVGAILQGTNMIRQHNINARNEKLDNPKKPFANMVFVVAASNYTDQLDTAVTSRFTLIEILNPNPKVTAEMYSSMIQKELNKKIKGINNSRKGMDLLPTVSKIPTAHPLIKLLVENCSFAPREMNEKIVMPFINSLKSYEDVKNIIRALKYEKINGNNAKNIQNLKKLKQAAKMIYDAKFAQSALGVKKTRKAEVSRMIQAGTLYFNYEDEIQRADISLLEFVIGYSEGVNPLASIREFADYINSYIKGLRFGFPIDLSTGKEIVPTPPKRAVFLYGAPGTGKTQFAFVLAKILGMNLLIIDSASLTTDMQGSGPANIRAAIMAAKIAGPCIIFFDEFEAAAPDRNALKNDSQNSGDKTITFLNVMNENDNLFDKRYSLIYMAASNFKTKIDAAVLRRFNPRVLRIDYPNKAGRLAILEAQVNKYNSKHPGKELILNPTLNFTDENFGQTNILDCVFIRDELEKTVGDERIKIKYWRRPNTSDCFNIGEIMCNIAAKSASKNITASIFARAVKDYKKNKSDIIISPTYLQKVIDENNAKAEAGISIYKQEPILAKEYFNDKDAKDLPELAEYVAFDDAPMIEDVFEEDDLVDDYIYGAEQVAARAALLKIDLGQKFGFKRSDAMPLILDRLINFIANDTEVPNNLLPDFAKELVSSKSKFGQNIKKLLNTSEEDIKSNKKDSFFLTGYAQAQRQILDRLGTNADDDE